MEPGFGILQEVPDDDEDGTPDGDDGFEVLQVDAPHQLVLGALFDAAGKRQLRFDASRPEKYWHITWAFVLEALDELRAR